MAKDSTDKIELESESGSSSSQEEMVMEMDIPQPVIGLSSVSITKTERAWSPSRPIPDSSDDDEPGPSVPDHNVYSIPKNDYTRILVLQPNETLALVGVYSFCVLQGSISLLGVILSPSNIKHTVFAPRSSPIPILSWATSVHQGSCTFPIPPSIRQQENATAILIEYTDTGVEGLGRISKIFDGVFKPPREPEAGPGIDIPRIYIVHHSSKDIRPFVLPSSWEVAFASLEDQPDSEMNSALEEREKYIGTYRRVAFLECDLGQSEFTPGGLVALNLVENYVFGLPLAPDPHAPYMHILTPLPTGLLAQARILVKGEMELPIRGMLDFREDDQGRVAGIERWGKGEGVGGEKRRVSQISWDKSSRLYKAVWPRAKGNLDEGMSDEIGHSFSTALPVAIITDSWHDRIVLLLYELPRTPSQTIVWANPNSEQAGCQLSTIRWNSAVSTMAGSFGSRPEVNSLQKRMVRLFGHICNIADAKLVQGKPDIRGRFTEDRLRAIDPFPLVLS
ncbi:hypothetical protein L210DRAFT_3627381 [Boletus edulis BED1]|uniref:Uncharacterized protein n=1 Tax=Boletus edulis BED1 TaxID=1328754 RepID=A0AAD4C7P3_BOLED|nr:hypothetical protein L210DRAFT_3627381 [Boletus edulis BED1]